MKVADVIDVTDTGKDGYNFIRLNTGMNDILRPTLYGSLHPITLFCREDDEQGRQEKEYVVIGHNCESGDILTPEQGDPEKIRPRRLKEARIGDLVMIGGAGAYCASMRAKDYNFFESAKEIFVED